MVVFLYFQQPPEQNSGNSTTANSFLQTFCNTHSSKKEVFIHKELTEGFWRLAIDQFLHCKKYSIVIFSYYVSGSCMFPFFHC